MKNNELKQSEIFALLALVFMILAVDSVTKIQENPPIITLSEEDESFRFQSGSAELQESFVIKLMDEIIPKVDSLSQAYNCNAIQIIGHTSGSPIGRMISAGNASNLDKHLAETIYDRQNQLHAGSNVDLGMMRALSVMKVFRGYQNDTIKTLQNIQYWLPYSAGPLILESGQLIPQQSINSDHKLDDASRRRIEIRLFKYQDAANQVSL